jgi:transcriptional regulator with XRE-family HTH domain
MGAALGISQPHVSRYELGIVVPDRALLRTWLSVAEVDRESRDEMTALTEAAHNETRPWLDMLGSDSHLQTEARIRDEEARLIRVCQLEWIPGLLQTAEYARLQLPQVDPTDRMDYPAAVAARMERQQVLYGTGRILEFLIAETALLWQPGPGVMLEQLDKLLSAATLAAVDLRVLPSRRAGAASWTSFEYREAKEDGRATITTEWLHGGGEFSDPEQVLLYRLLWTRLWEASAAGKDAVELIRDIRAGLTHCAP